VGGVGCVWFLWFFVGGGVWGGCLLGGGGGPLACWRWRRRFFVVSRRWGDIRQQRRAGCGGSVCIGVLSPGGGGSRGRVYLRASWGGDRADTRGERERLSSPPPQASRAPEREGGGAAPVPFRGTAALLAAPATRRGRARVDATTRQRMCVPAARPSGVSRLRFERERGLSLSLFPSAATPNGSRTRASCFPGLTRCRPAG